MNGNYSGIGTLPALPNIPGLNGDVNNQSEPIGGVPSFFGQSNSGNSSSSNGGNSSSSNGTSNPQNNGYFGNLLSQWETFGTALSSNILWDIGFILLIVVLVYVAVAPEVNK